MAVVFFEICEPLVLVALADAKEKYAHHIKYHDSHTPLWYSDFLISIQKQIFPAVKIWNFVIMAVAD